MTDRDPGIKASSSSPLSKENVQLDYQRHARVVVEQAAGQTIISVAAARVSIVSLVFIGLGGLISVGFILFGLLALIEGEVSRLTVAAPASFGVLLGLLVAESISNLGQKIRIEVSPRRLLFIGKAIYRTRTAAWNREWITGLLIYYLGTSIVGHKNYELRLLSGARCAGQLMTGRDEEEIRAVAIVIAREYAIPLASGGLK